MVAAAPRTGWPAGSLMSDLLNGIISSLSQLLLNWVWPILLASLIFCYLLVLPTFTDVAANLFTEIGAAAALLLAFGSLTAGFVMSALSTSLYRVLEGYYWPRPMRGWGRRRQEARYRKLLSESERVAGVEQALHFEKLSRFPADPEEMAPTSFGNAMRSFETFGVNRYRLDSQGFWAELTNVVPAGLRDEVGRSRSAVDFFVCLTFVSAAFAGANLVAFGVHGSARFLIAAAAGIVAVPACYRGAVSSTAYWHNTVAAVINLGRKPLADALGLEMPTTLERERVMWERLAAFNFYPYDEEWAGALNEFRAAAKPAPTRGPTGNRPANLRALNRARRDRRRAPR